MPFQHARRWRWLGTVAAAALMLGGCAKSDEEQPETALGDKPGQLMPPQRPAADLSILADQTGKETLKAPKISYDPLLSSASKSAKKPQGNGKVDRGTKSAGSAGMPAARTAAISGGKHTKVGSLLSGIVGVLPGSHRGRGAAATSPEPPAGATAKPAGKTPPRPAASGGDDDEDEDVDSAPAKPRAKPAPSTSGRPSASKPGKPATVPLVEAKEENTEIPANAAGYAEEQLEATRAAAEAEAIKGLIRRAYQLPLSGGKTVGEAIGEKAEDFSGPLEGYHLVGVRWVNEMTLEVTAQITIAKLIEALSKMHEKASFSPLKGLGEGKAIEAKGAAAVPGAEAKKQPGDPFRPPKGAKKSN